MFSNGLTDKKTNTAGMLLLSMTGREVMDHIEDKTMTDIVSTQAYCDLLVQMTTKVYVPNGNGALQYLKDIKQDQFGANILKLLYSCPGPERAGIVWIGLLHSSRCPVGGTAQLDVGSLELRVGRRVS